MGAEAQFVVHDRGSQTRGSAGSMRLQLAERLRARVAAKLRTLCPQIYVPKPFPYTPLYWVMKQHGTDTCLSQTCGAIIQVGGHETSWKERRNLNFVHRTIFCINNDESKVFQLFNFNL